MSNPIKLAMDLEATAPASTNVKIDKGTKYGGEIPNARPINMDDYAELVRLGQIDETSFPHDSEKYGLMSDAIINKMKLGDAPGGLIAYMHDNPGDDMFGEYKTAPIRRTYFQTPFMQTPDTLWSSFTGPDTIDIYPSAFREDGSFVKNDMIPGTAYHEALHTPYSYSNTLRERQYLHPHDEHDHSHEMSQRSYDKYEDEMKSNLYWNKDKDKATKVINSIIHGEEL
tara:strand:+ start:18 stop:698 length:681 start_codon:yes stop_codon:yes gene_type:complete